MSLNLWNKNLQVTKLAYFLLCPLTLTFKLLNRLAILEATMTKWLHIEVEAHFSLSQCIPLTQIPFLWHPNHFGMLIISLKIVKINQPSWTEGFISKLAYFTCSNVFLDLRKLLSDTKITLICWVLTEILAISFEHNIHLGSHLE